MKKISILIILPSLVGGGAEKVTLSLLENLDKNIFVCNLILLNAHGPLKAKINSEHIIDLKSQHFRHAFPSLIKTIRHIKPDVIFSTFPHITLPILLIRKFFTKNMIIISREPNMIKFSLRYSPYSLILKILHKLLLPTADKVIVNSQAMYKDLSKRGVKINKLALVHNPIDHLNIRRLSNFNRHAGRGLRLIAMGRLVKQKGLDRLIPILKNLKNAHLTILGEGSEYNNLINLVKSLDRGTFITAQTPQGFNRKKILKAYKNNYFTAADDAAIALKAGMRVSTIDGEPSNIKITRPTDFKLAELYMEN